MLLLFASYPRPNPVAPPDLAPVKEHDRKCIKIIGNAVSDGHLNHLDAIL